MENMRNDQFEKITLDDLAKASGGVIVDEGNGKFWVVRQDGTVYAPAPSLEKAIEYAKTLSISTEILTPDEVLPEQDELLDLYLEKQANGTAAQAVEAVSFP